MCQAVLTHTSAVESRGSQRRARLRHTVPLAAMSLLSHDARQQMAVWQEGENNCAHARRPPTRFSTSEPNPGTVHVHWGWTVNYNVTKPQCGLVSVFSLGFFCKVAVGVFKWCFYMQLYKDSNWKISPYPSASFTFQFLLLKTLALGDFRKAVYTSTLTERRSLYCAPCSSGGMPFVMSQIKHRYCLDLCNHLSL